MHNRKTRRGGALVACVLAALLVVPVRAGAQEIETAAGGDNGAEASPAASADDAPSPGFWQQTGAGARNIWSSGGSDVYLPGYIWHLPYRYTEEQISRYNTAAWGIGYGRTLRSGAANHPRTLYAIVSADSYSKPQYMAGYAWRARWHPGGGAFALSGGYTALVIGRQDKASYAPLPIALPLGSVGVDRFELMGAYVPYFDVGFFFLRLNFGEGPRAARQK